MSPLHPESGVVVGGRYVLTSPVAGGGMGEVWRAQDDVLGREVAVKLLRREYASDEAFLGRFRAEARHAASLGHPGIAQVYDYGEDDGTAYLVMELVPGEPLSARISRDGAIPAAEAVPLLQQAAQALHAAHRTGLVHRDVKPGNLLITPDHRVKITDFGISRAGDQAPMTRTGEVMGTAQYLSPEQAMGRVATPESDVYGLGVVAYEMLTGRRPFEADTAVAVALAQVNSTPPPLPSSVPGPVAAVVMQALEKDPARRPASAAAFADLLGAALAGQWPDGAPVTPATDAGAPTVQVPPLALPPEPVTPAAPMTTVTRTTGPEPAPERRSRAGLWVAIVVVLLLLAGGIAYALTGRNGGDTGGATATPPATSSTTSSSSTSSTSSSTSDATFDLDNADYRCRPADDVENDLRRLGLKVTRTNRTSKDCADGQVLSVNPTAALQQGDTVQLRVAVPPKTTTTTTTTTTTSTPPTSPTSSTSSSSSSSTDTGTGAGDPTGTDAPTAPGSAAAAPVQPPKPAKPAKPGKHVPPGHAP